MFFDDKGREKQKQEKNMMAVYFEHRNENFIKRQ
jgi:hypothetical protein